jgi:prephenate dehydrogenase (NADP+)
MIRTNVSPNDPPEEHPTIGLIGMGAMGAMYARELSKAGWKKSNRLFIYLHHHLISFFFSHRISVCDLPEKYDSLKLQYKGFCQSQSHAVLSLTRPS